MALATDQKNSVVTLREFWNGKFFLIFSAIFLWSLVILSTFPAGLFTATSTLAIGLLVLGVLSRSRFISLTFIIPLVIAFRMSNTFSSFQDDYELLSEYLSANSSIEGVVTALSGVKNGSTTAQMESQGITFLATLPPEREILLGRSVRLDHPSIAPATYSQMARWSAALLTANSFKIMDAEIPARFGIRRFLLQKIKEVFPPPESTLLAGVLLGDASEMDDEFNATYRSIGLSHITVVSGSNISFVLTTLLCLLILFPKRIRVFFAILGVIGYVLLVGTDPPVLRAATMGIIGALALIGNGRLDTFRVLVFTGIVLLCFSPLSLMYDIGFQLSFLATLWIIVSSKVLRKKNTVVQSVGVSIFAAIWTLPVSIGIFGYLHAWSIPANILVGPVVGWSMLLGLIGLVAFSIWQGVGLLISHAAFYCLAWIGGVASILGNLPGVLQVDSPLRTLIGFLSVGLIGGLSLRYLYLPKRSDTVDAPFLQR